MLKRRRCEIVQDSVRWVDSGVLYVVGTPIGNLHDWSPRAIQVLREADLILCEDTRVTGLLCHQFQIETPLLSFHEHNTQTRIPQIAARLASGEAIALVSDRGMPGLSDPGQELVDYLWKTGGKVSVIPGPTAALTAFVASGFPAPFTFWGFLPRAGKERRIALDDIRETAHTGIIYEAPHHFKKTLADLVATGNDARTVMLAREMTKQYEEFWRGPLSQLAEFDREWRGEIVLVIGPKDPKPVFVPEWNDLRARVLDLVAEGIPKKEAIRRIASEFSLSKRELYHFVVSQED